MMKTLSDREFSQVTIAFCERLSSAMSNAGCNDLFTDEFPESVCKNFASDHSLLDCWKRELNERVRAANGQRGE